MRNLPPAMVAALEAAQLGTAALPPAFLCELDLGMHIIQAWSGIGELEWKGRRFGNTGAIAQVIGGMSNIEESGEAKATGVAFFISGIDRNSPEGGELVRIANEEVRRGGLCSAWFAVLADNGTLSGEPFQISSTYVDFPLIRIEPPPAGITIMLQTETKRVRHRNRPGRRATHEDHQIGHPGDLIYQYKNELQDKTV